MKKHVFFFISLFVLSLNAISQDKINLVVFSEDGDAFFAYVNGIRQNDKPETNVKVVGVSPNISLRIDFQDKAYPSLKQAGPLEPGFEHTLRIKKDAKKQMKLRYFGQTPITNEVTPGVATVQYHSTENTMTDNSTTTVSSPNTINTVSSTTTTTRTSQSNGDAENVGVNINMGGVGISMNVSGMDNMGTMNTNSSTTVTSTSSSNSGSSSHSSYDNSNQTSSVGNTGSSKAGCSAAMNQANFAKMKQSVADKPFSDTKMSTAKVATKNACLSVNQVKEICKLFSMDDDKLAYAKYAYDYCIDRANYYQVSEVFAFSATTDDFNKFLEQ